MNEEQTDALRGDWLDHAMKKALASFRLTKPGQPQVKGNVIFAEERFKQRGTAR